MIDPNPHYIAELQSDLRAVKEGWYAINKHGVLLLGPFSNRESCLTRISQAVNWAEFKGQPIGPLKPAIACSRLPCPSRLWLAGTKEYH
jgi:hypothetical protein